MAELNGANQFARGYDGYLRRFVPTILAMHERGATTGEIAEAIRKKCAWELVVSSSMVLYVLKRSGAVVAQKNGAQAAKQTEQIVAMRRQGMTLKQIAEAVGRSSQERIRQTLMKQERIEQGRAERNALLTRWNATRDLDISVAILDLTMRARLALKNLRINTLGDLVQTPEIELIHCNNLGAISRALIKSELAKLKLSLAQE